MCWRVRVGARMSGFSRVVTVQQCCQDWFKGPRAAESGKYACASSTKLPEACPRWPSRNQNPRQWRRLLIRYSLDHVGKVHWMHTWKLFASSLESSPNADIYFAQQKAETAQPSLESGENLPELFSKRKLPYCLEYNPRSHGMWSSRVWHTMQTNFGTGR